MCYDLRYHSGTCLAGLKDGRRRTGLRADILNRDVPNNKQWYQLLSCNFRLVKKICVNILTQKRLLGVSDYE
jgi:hypothetical protein